RALGSSASGLHRSLWRGVPRSQREAPGSDGQGPRAGAEGMEGPARTALRRGGPAGRRPRPGEGRHRGRQGHSMADRGALAKRRGVQGAAAGAGEEGRKDPRQPAPVGRGAAPRRVRAGGTAVEPAAGGGLGGAAKREVMSGSQSASTHYSSLTTCYFSSTDQYAFSRNVFQDWYFRWVSFRLSSGLRLGFSGLRIKLM